MRDYPKNIDAICKYSIVCKKRLKTMCEIADAVLAESGYSLKGFLEWRNKRYGVPKKLTRQQWLDKFRDCTHCKFDGMCKSQRFGYHQRIHAVHDGNGNVSMVAADCHVNQRLYPYAGSSCSCCSWDRETLEVLCRKVNLIAKGEVNE